MPTTIHTSRFGAMEVKEEDVIRFPEGLPGFEATRRYVLAPHKTASGQPSPFRWLICVDEPDVALPVVNPWSVVADYSPTVSGGVLRNLAITDVRSQAQVIAIVTIPRNDPAGVTVNLLAPIFVNRDTKTARQVIVLNENYEFRTPMIPSTHTKGKIPAARTQPRELAAAAA